MNTQIPDEAERSARYAAPAIFLHWVLAVFIFNMLGLGWYMMSIEDDPGSDWYFNLHKSVGVFVAFLIVVRIIWRVGHTPRTLPLSVQPWQVVIARTMHFLLYLVMIVIPVTGICGALLSKRGITFFGQVLPRLVKANHDLSEIFFDIHSFAAWVLVGLITVHILAGLKHLLIDRDGVFQRMWIFK